MISLKNDKTGDTLTYAQPEDFFYAFQDEIEYAVFQYAYSEHHGSCPMFVDEEMPKDIVESFFSSTDNYNFYTKSPWKITDDTDEEDFEECCEWYEG